MPLPLLGLHHVSSLSARIGRTHDFFSRILGMRPLIKTVNQDAPSMYHLFYGDAAGNPGSEMTIFDLPNTAPERPGNNSISLTTFRVAGSDVLDFWRERFAELGVPHREPAERDGRRVLDFADFEGTQLSLVDDGGRGEASPWPESQVPPAHQLRGLGYTMITVPDHEPTGRFVTEGLGLRYDHSYSQEDAAGAEVHVYRMANAGPSGEVHVIVRDDLPRARYGAGGVHHFALRVPDEQPMEEWVERLNTLGYVNSGIVERYYFTSVYVREPNHVLFELATDGPGFEVDGPLGMDHLKLPPFLEPRRMEIEAALQPLT